MLEVYRALPGCGLCHMLPVPTICIRRCSFCQDQIGKASHEQFRIRKRTEVGRSRSASEPGACMMDKGLIYQILA